jgi:DNA-binding response OmpR family regulator
MLSETLAILQPSGSRPGGNGDERVLRGLGIELDLDRRTVTQDGVPLSLTPTEFQLLAYLMAAGGNPINAEVMVMHVQGYQCEPEEARALVRVHISRLRQKVEVDPAEPRIVVTVRGIGYAFGCQPEDGRLIP